VTPALSASEVAAYRARGIQFPFKALDHEEIAAALARLEAAPAEIRRSLMTSKSHLVSRTLYDIARRQAIVAHAASLVGDDVLVWGAGFFSKDGGSDSYVSWHQDATYWGLEPDDVVTAWVALTPSTVENGCMRVVPGTHRGEVMPHNETYAEANLLSRGQEIAVAVDEASAIDVVLKPGEMSLHHVKLAHSSPPNRSAGRRVGFAIRYIGAHVRQRGGFRDAASLVRGENRHGNFELEPAPRGELDPADVEFHQRVSRAARAKARAMPAM
jgi:ectoine hydroxylase-related dioxygenase (phytanoyl-CoA dioxygenase family)